MGQQGLSAEEQQDIKNKMTERENLLLPVYLQIALQYADMHDRAGRMKAKETIRAPLQWAQARRYFYWRLRRGLNGVAQVLGMLPVAEKEEVLKWLQKA